MTHLKKEFKRTTEYFNNVNMLQNNKQRVEKRPWKSTIPFPTGSSPPGPSCYRLSRDFGRWRLRGVPCPWTCRHPEAHVEKSRHVQHWERWHIEHQVYVCCNEKILKHMYTSSAFLTLKKCAKVIIKIRKFHEIHYSNKTREYPRGNCDNYLTYFVSDLITCLLSCQINYFIKKKEQSDGKTRTFWIPRSSLCCLTKTRQLWRDRKCRHFLFGTRAIRMKLLPVQTPFPERTEIIF